MDDRSDQKVKGYILFDGKCGICTNSMHFFSKYEHITGFKTLPLQHEMVKDITEISEEQLSKDIYIIINDENKTHLKGVDAYLVLTENIIWFKPFHFLLKFKPAKKLADKIYRIIADRRKKISKVCRIPVRPYSEK